MEKNVNQINEEYMILPFEKDGLYYENIWKTKLSLKEYSSLDRRWRSRWDFAESYINNNSIVLDAGCGDGVLGEKLIRDKECEVFGLDLSKFALSIAEKRGLKVSLCDISYDNLTFNDSTFDYVVLSCVLEHIRYPENALKEASRILKDNGKIIVTLPNVTYISNRLTLLFGKIPDEFLHNKPGEGLHLRFFDYKNDFEQFLQVNNVPLKPTVKIGELKNPKKYNKLSKKTREILMKTMPNLFAQYTHFVLEKK